MKWLANAETDLGDFTPFDIKDSRQALQCNLHSQREFVRVARGKSPYCGNGGISRAWPAVCIRLWQMPHDNCRQLTGFGPSRTASHRSTRRSRRAKSMAHRRLTTCQFVRRRCVRCHEADRRERRETILDLTSDPFHPFG